MTGSIPWPWFVINLIVITFIIAVEQMRIYDWRSRFEQEEKHCTYWQDCYRLLRDAIATGNIEKLRLVSAKGIWVSDSKKFYIEKPGSHHYLGPFDTEQEADVALTKLQVQKAVN